MAFTNVRFIQTTAAKFATIEPQDGYFYIISDTSPIQVYCGNQRLNNAEEITAAIEALDGTATIATESGGIVTLKAGLTEVDGVIDNNSNSDIILAKAATSGAAGDVTFTPDASSDLTETDVNAAILELEDNLNSVIDGLDVTEFALASVANNVVSIAGIKEQDGKIAIGTDNANKIVLEEVAYTGSAGDVSYDNTTSGLSSTTVQGSLDELAEASAGGVASKTVYMTDNTSTAGTNYAAIYQIFQGSEGSAASPVQGELIGTINIPKDQFLDESTLVDITFNNGALYDGATDVTELIKGTGGTATAADAGKYIKFVFQLPDSKSTIYLAVNDLIDVYTAEQNAAEIQVAIDSNNVVSASVVDIDGTKVTYIAADSSASPAVARESVSAALARLDGDDQTTGSVSKKIKDAIDALDTVSDVAIATDTNDIITIAGSVKEENGVIATGTASTVTLAKAAKTGAAADISITDSGNHFTATDVEAALQEIAGALVWETLS